MYPGVWRHGDWIRITERGSAVIEGRSDSTLNRQGIRFGTSELYGVVEACPRSLDSLVIGLELPGGGYRMPLFVVLADGVELDDALKGRINGAIRAALSQRHVPDEIVAVPAVPRTLTGKKMEVPVKRLLQGRPLAEVAASGATADPQALEWFEGYAVRGAQSTVEEGPMGFLRRLRGEPPPVPEWASFFTADEYNAFLDVVRAELDKNGAQYTIDDALVRISGTDEQFGLSNLAQLAHATERSDWPELVAGHFANLRATTGRDLDALAGDFDQVKSTLRVRLIADESMGGMSLDDVRGSRAYAPGDPLVLVYDFPDSTASVPPDHVEGWPLEADAVWEVAIDNVRLEPQPTRQEVPAQGSVFTFAIDDSFYVATRALRLADELPAGTVDAVFAVPNRHMLLWHAIRDVSVVGAMQAMMQVTSKAFLDGPGSISDQLYWWHDGEVVHLPVRAQGNSIDFMPPEEFVALLNTLAAP